MSNDYVAIMAGGVGSRFWPGSREARPKQFLDMMGVGKSLLRLTFERFLPIIPKENVFIVTNEAYKTLVLEQIPEISEKQILCEPSRNNTAPCVAYAAMKIANLNPKANMVVAPSDHIILKEEAFLNHISSALNFAASKSALVTLGIEPSRPDTGYGYIQYDKKAKNGIHDVQRFAEKPNLDTAKAFLASGDYLWNAGIFIWSVKSVLEAYKTHANEIFNILTKGAKHYNTSEEQNFINKYYPTTPNISVDFAIMEKADNVYTIPANVAWSDLGTWGSLYAECEKDSQGNVLQGSKNLIALDSSNCLIRTTAGKLVVLKDLDDYMVIDEADVLLIHPKHKEQEIKKLTEIVKKDFNSLI
jgi:mannose-1-phosphate guanylyltransferase